MECREELQGRRWEHDRSWTAGGDEGVRGRWVDGAPLEGIMESKQKDLELWEAASRLCQEG